MKKLITYQHFISTLLFTLYMSSNAHAIPVAYTHSSTAGISYNTTGVAAFTTGGDEMDGMSVTAVYSTGGSETTSYNDVIGDDFGSAVGNGWSLSFFGSSTFGSDWTLESSSVSISQLIIDGQPGDTLFDYLLEYQLTPGSASGGPGNPAGPDNVDSTDGSISADFSYSNQVSLKGIFYGDLFTTLTISFDGPLTSNNTFKFITDTDNVKISGDIKPTNPIPEPGVLALLSAGLIGMIGLQRRKKTA